MFICALQSHLVNVWLFPSKLYLCFSKKEKEGEKTQFHRPVEIHDTIEGYQGRRFAKSVSRVRRAENTKGYVLQDKRGIRKISREHNFPAGDVTQPDRRARIVMRPPSLVTQLSRNLFFSFILIGPAASSSSFYLAFDALPGG